LLTQFMKQPSRADVVSAPAVTAIVWVEPPVTTRRTRSSRRGHWWIRGSQERLGAAAVLALVDRPWSRRELRSVLDEQADPDATIECRAALREGRDPAARQAADDWEARHPDRGEAPWPSDRSVYRLGGGCERALAARMGQLRDRVLRARDREPDDGPGQRAEQHRSE
jgi:hypothetical protein